MTPIRRHLFPALPACLALLLTACATLSPDPRQMHFPPVSVTEPEVEVVQLENGMRLYLLADRELPLIGIRALIRTGSVYEPPEKGHIARFAGTLLRKGGAGDLGADELDRALSDAAIHLSSSVSAESASASLNSLTRTFPEALGYFADMLKAPRFDEAQLVIQKQAAIEALRRKNDRPGNIARREAAKLVYGENHPLARETSAAEIEAVTRADLLDFHHRYYHPNNMMLGITGDFDRDQVIAAIKRAFGDWPRAEVNLIKPVPVPEIDARRVAFVHRPLDQVSIRMTHVSILRSDPDYYALNLANRILGRGFTSRLFQEIRTNRGLAYSAGSGLSAGSRDLGTFVMATRTRSESAGEAARVMLAELELMRTEKVTEQELAEAKDAFLNAFVFKSVSVGQLVNRRMSLDYFDMPKDEMTRLRENTLAVTADDILRVVQSHLHPDSMIIVAVGRRGVLTDALAPLGDVIEIPLEEME